MKLESYVRFYKYGLITFVIFSLGIGLWGIYWLDALEISFSHDYSQGK